MMAATEEEDEDDCPSAADNPALLPLGQENDLENKQFRGNSYVEINSKMRNTISSELF